MHHCIDTALNIGDTSPFTSGSDIIYICDDDVLWRVSFNSTSWRRVDCIAHNTYECLYFGWSRLQRKLGEASDAWPYIIWERCRLCEVSRLHGTYIYTSWPRSAPTKDQVRSLFLPIVLLKMRYENVKLQMRLNQGPNDDVDGHEMNKIQWYQHNWGDLIEKYVYDQERSKLNDSLRSTSL